MRPLVSRHQGRTDVVQTFGLYTYLLVSQSANAAPEPEEALPGRKRVEFPSIGLL